ncbi:MAG TPA: glycosyltransferase family 2 protein [Candidatus Polarisedimenticolaceae bacterium]|nr:glycosyltransferase family 2 protein [Candidatus Polarisedimenticolaceae bacterium]
MNDAVVGLDLSIVAPVYNERPNLEPFVAEVEAALRDSGMSHEILLVDDGSTDGSSELIDRLAGQTTRVRAIHLRANRGQTAAFDAGFKYARGRIVVTIDADLQNDPRDIIGLVAELERYDAAVGYRRTRQDRWLRRVSSTIANRVRNSLSGDDIIDTGCSLKAFRRETLSSLKLYTGMHRFLPTLLRIEGYRVVQRPVAHRPRHAGHSKYGVRNRAVRAFVDLLAVRWMKRRHLGYEIVTPQATDQRDESSPASSSRAK